MKPGPGTTADRRAGASEPGRLCAAAAGRFSQADCPRHPAPAIPGDIGRRRVQGGSGSNGARMTAIAFSLLYKFRVHLPALPSQGHTEAMVRAAERRARWERWRARYEADVALEARLGRARFRLQAAKTERAWAVVSAHRDGLSDLAVVELDVGDAAVVSGGFRPGSACGHADLIAFERGTQ